MKEINENMEQLENDFKLEVCEELFPHCEMLKRSVMEGFEASMWEEQCIAAAEGDLTENHLTVSDKDFIEATVFYRGLRLKADPEEIFEAKSSLKHRPVFRPVAIWLGVAVAAAVAVIVTIPLFTPDIDRGPAIAAIQPLPSHAEINAGQVIQNQADRNQAPETNINKPANRTVTRSLSVSIISGVEHLSVDQMTNEDSMEEFSPPPLIAQGHQLLAEATKPAFNDMLLVTQPETRSAETVAVMPQNDDTETEERGSILRNLAQTVGFAKADPRVKPGNIKPLERLSEKGIVKLNTLLSKETVVVKEYDDNGKLTYYAVQSGTLSFSRSY